MFDFQERNKKYEPDLKDFDNAFANSFAGTFSSFNIAQIPEFLKLIEVANARITVKHPSTYSRHMEEKSEHVLEEVQKILREVKDTLQSISFTSDLWTSRALDSYISLTCHFIDDLFRMNRWNPAVKPMEKRHTNKL